MGVTGISRMFLLAKLPLRLSWTFLSSLFIGSVLCLVLVSLVVCRFGSLVAFVAFLKGHTFVILPAQADLGTCCSGDRRSTSFTIRNLSERPLRVVGAKTACSCVVANALPISVPARESRTIPIQVHINRRSSDYCEPIVFFVDDGSVHTRSAKIRARVSPQEDPDSRASGERSLARSLSKEEEEEE